MWLKTIILFLVPHLSSSACGVGLSENLKEKIVGGRDAEEGEFPWQASLQRITWLGFYHMCGASLITSEWLVSAAHCIQTNSANSYRIMIGTNNLTATSEDQIYLIKRIIIKQGFDAATFHNDIALIQLFHPVLDSLIPICLTTDSPEDDLTAVITGWGATEDNGQASPYLQAADVMIIPRNICLVYYEDLTESMTCAGYDEGGIDSCQGDSGGPLLQWRDGYAYLVGVVSWGVGCAEPGHPGVYTDVTQFFTWIKSYIE